LTVSGLEDLFLKNLILPQVGFQLSKNWIPGGLLSCGLNAKSDEIKAYEKAAKDANILIAEVGAWSNPISPDPKMAKEAFEKCTASLNLADQIGAKCCVNIAGSEIGKTGQDPIRITFQMKPLK
jgi:sugar phosphate isomerase/epimerase